MQLDRNSGTVIQPDLSYALFGQSLLTFLFDHWDHNAVALTVLWNYCYLLIRVSDKSRYLIIIVNSGKGAEMKTLGK